MKNQEPQTPDARLMSVGSTEWLEDWQRRYDEAEDKWERAKWARFNAEKREARTGHKVQMLRREYKAAESSNEKISDQ